MEPLNTQDPESTNGRIPAGSKLGRFEVLRLISVGGMGEVYLARDDQLGRKVAIKILNEKYERHEANLQRFIQEAKAASALNHPNILTIHEIGEVGGSQFIVSEYVDGHTLHTLLNQRKLPLFKILDVSIQTAEALSAAHIAGIIHRDIKPENIIVRNDGYVKVVDFGLAKLLPSQPSLVGLEDETIRQNQTAEGLILGTVSYMSPEQAKGEAVDERTDVFSLGVVTYEMLSGRRPFEADSVSERFANLINKEPAPLSRYADIPDGLQKVVSKMLRKAPDERYETMNDLIADLSELKEEIATESKRARSSLPESEKVTDVMPAVTVDAPKFTRESSGVQLPWYRRTLVLVVVPLLLLGILAFAWYWRGQTLQPQPQIKSLAVLPLKSLNSQEDVLGLGIADALIRKISQTGQLTVRPISAVRRYLTADTDALTAAKELSTDAVLEGSVQRSNDRLRIGVNLLRSSDGTSLWSDNFDMSSGDIFAIQDAVAQQVASRLQLKLDPEQLARLGKRSTSNPIAYEYYVKGVNSLDQRGFGPKAKPQMELTIDLFKKAVEADPNYALARARLAFAYIHKGLFIAPDDLETLARLAKEEINRADLIDPQLAETHVARSWFLFSGYEGYQIEAAAHEVLIAQQLDPNVGHVDLAGSYYHMGLDDLAEREYKRALEIDPTSGFIKNQFVFFYYYVARWDDYFAASQRYVPGEDLDPYYLITKGRLAEAEKVIEDAAAKDPDDQYLPAGRAMLYAAKSDSARAVEQNQIFIRSLDKRVPSYHHDVYAIAEVYAMIGKTDEAMKWLRESAATGFPSYTTFERDRFLDNIRKSPEFIQFMGEMKQLYEKRRNEFQ